MRIGRKGNALTIVLMITAMFALVSYFILSFVQSRRGNTEEELRFLQAKLLAGDIVELGKYFLAYEKVIFMDNPLAMSENRRIVLTDFAQQSYGSLAANNSFLLNACGGYDANASEVGDFKANGELVFCPYFVRNPLMDGAMFENMMLKMWSRSGSVGVLSMSGGVLETKTTSRPAIMQKTESGAYELTIDLKKVLADSDNQYVRLFSDEKLVRSFRDGSFDAKMVYTFYSSSAGFETISNERYVTVRAEVNYGPPLFRRSASASESLIMYTSSVKDFALFIIYPETSSGLPTKKFSESMKLGGTDSRVNGRVFFNGDIDVDLAALPVFTETVVISGDIVVNTSLSQEDYRKLMREKFRKGLVVRFPVEKLINDGACVAGIVMANQSGMFCKRPLVPTENFGISDYISNLRNVCSDLKVTVNNGAYKYLNTNATDSMSVLNCEGSAPEKLFLSGGAMDVEVSGSHAYIVSPIKKISIKAPANIYGTILGGYVEAQPGTKFFSLSSIKKGMAGIASDTDLAAVSSEGARIQEGVGVPLLNLPLIKKPYLGK